MRCFRLASTGGDVVGLQTDLVDDRRETRDEVLQRLLVESTAAQVDAVGVGVEDADGHRAGDAADDEQRLLRKADSALGKGSSQETLGAAPASVRRQRSSLSASLDGIRHTHEGARAAASGVEVVALHQGARLRRRAFVQDHG